MTEEAAAEDFQNTILRLLHGHDWMVLRVSDEADELAWSYTIGLWERFGHPELIAIGLPEDTAHDILNIAGEAISGGTVFRSEDLCDQLAVGVPMKMTATSPRVVWDFVQAARWYYLEHRKEDEPPPFLQCVWPDRNGKFPSEPGWGETQGWPQPILN